MQCYAMAFSSAVGVGQSVKLVFLTLFIIILSIFINIYLKLAEPIRFGNYRLEIKSFADENFRAKLQEKIEQTWPSWNEGMFARFSSRVGRCYAICSEVNSISISYHSNCRTNPVLIFDDNVTEDELLNMTRASATVPCIFELKESGIPNVGRGIFTKYKIPKGFVFGPYEGIRITSDNTTTDKDWSYAWTVNPDDGQDQNVDGIDENTSNWLRWINSARWYEEQNMMALVLNKSIYYITYKEIEPNVELLIWYGREYAKFLQIFALKGSNHSWNSGYAPGKDIVICPTCPLTEGEVDEESEANEEPKSDTVEDSLVENVQKENGG